MAKLKKIIFICLTISLVLIPFGTASAITPGSAADPLVTRSWTLDYLDSQFAALEEQLVELKALALQWGNKSDIDIQLFIGKSKAYVNGKSYYIDPAHSRVVPHLKHDSYGDGYTMVPARFVAESLGVEVEWLGATKQVVFTDGADTIVIKLKDKKAYINGKKYTMGYAPFSDSDGRSYVHVRFIAEAFDCQVEWNQQEKRVDISR